MENAVLIFFSLIFLIALAFVIKKWTTVKDFTNDVRDEMYKVTWPTQFEITQSTLLVFVVTGILTVMVWGVDWVLGAGMTGLMKLFL
jgi:preprotein translocase subunit SecE